VRRPAEEMEMATVTRVHAPIQLPVWYLISAIFPQYVHAKNKVSVQECEWQNITMSIVYENSTDDDNIRAGLRGTTI
jgi:hypothetical protein